MNTGELSLPRPPLCPTKLTPSRALPDSSDPGVSPRGCSRRCKYLDSPGCLWISGCCRLERTTHEILYLHCFCFVLCFKESLAQKMSNEPELMEPRLKNPAMSHSWKIHFPCWGTALSSLQVYSLKADGATVCCHLIRERFPTGVNPQL